MTRNSCQLMIKADGGPGCVQLQIYDQDQRLDVRDLSTRADIRVRAGDVSIYRHTLFLDGRAYRILNVVKDH